ncbi:MAG: Kelch repeat-containing protein [Saprospiraceae bacterium]
MKNCCYFFVTLGIVLLCWQCFTVKPAALEQGSWKEIKSQDGSLPQERHEAAFVGVGDKFYLLGGRRINPVSIYDPQKNIWTAGAASPIELHHFQPIVYQNEVYILGAMTGKYPGETPVPNIYIYNPQKDTWRKGAAIPTERLRGGAGAVLYKDKIYLVCGIKDGHRGDHKNWLDVFDLKTQQWQQLPDAPRARDHFQAVIANNKLYCLGGRTTVAADNPFKNTIAEVDVFDLKTQRWTTLSEPIPTPRAGNFTLLIGNEILVLGGESFQQKLAHSEIEALHTDTHLWRNLPALPRGRHGTGAILYNNKICTASGCGSRGGTPELADLWMFSF